MIYIAIVVAAAAALLFLTEKKSTTPVQAPAPVVVATPPSSAGAAALSTAATETTAVQTATAQIPVVGGAISAVEGVILGAHLARLKGAIAENQVIPQCVQAFDADLTDLVNAYNQGEATAAQCVAALEAMDLQLYTEMRGFIGAAGTAWQTSPANAGYVTTQQLIALGPINPAYGAPCDKTCTVSCCVYFNDLRPAIYGRNVVGAGNTSTAPYAANQNPPGSGIIMGAIAAVTMADAGKGPQTVKVVAVAPPDDPAYGNYSRAAYNVTFVKPSAVTTVANLI